MSGPSSEIEEEEKVPAPTPAPAFQRPERLTAAAASAAAPEAKGRTAEESAAEGQPVQAGSAAWEEPQGLQAAGGSVVDVALEGYGVVGRQEEETAEEEALSPTEGLHGVVTEDRRVMTEAQAAGAERMHAHATMQPDTEDSPRAPLQPTLLERMQAAEEQRTAMLQRQLGYQNMLIEELREQLRQARSATSSRPYRRQVRSPPRSPVAGLDGQPASPVGSHSHGGPVAVGTASGAVRPGVSARGRDPLVNISPVYTVGPIMSDRPGTSSLPLARAPAPRPPDFEGKPDEVERWISVMESQRARTQGMEDWPDALYISYCTEYFRAAAATWWMTRVREAGGRLDGGLSTRTEFFDAIRSRFLTSDRVLRAQTRFRVLRQVASVQAYADMFDRLYGETQEQWPPALLKEQFLLGLKPGIQGAVRSARFLRASLSPGDEMSMDDIRRCAVEADLTAYAARGIERSPPSGQRSSGRSRSGTGGAVRSQPRRENVNLVQSAPQPRRGRGKGNGRSNRGREQGSGRGSSAPAKENGRKVRFDEGSGSVGAGATSKRELLCYKCHQPGHFAKECPNRGRPSRGGPVSQSN